LGSRTVQHENIRYSQACAKKVCIATGGTITVVQCGVLCDQSHLAFTVTADKQARYSRSIYDYKQHSSAFDNHYLTSCLMIVTHLTVITDPMLFTWGKEWG
jgi:hypothetical protein